MAGRVRFNNGSLAVKSLRIGTGINGASAAFTNSDVTTSEGIFCFPLRDKSAAGYPTINGNWPAAFIDPTDGSHGALYCYMPGVGWRKNSFGAV